LSTEEKEALTELIALQKAGKIVIQPADKGSGICILDRQDYESEAYRQLNDTQDAGNGVKTNYYKKVTEKTVKDQFDDIKNVLDEGVRNNYISKDLAKQLLPSQDQVHSIFSQKFTRNTSGFQKEGQSSLGVAPTRREFPGFVTRWARNL
jgi:hypothetical protein